MLLKVAKSDGFKFLRKKFLYAQNGEIGSFLIPESNLVKIGT